MHYDIIACRRRHRFSEECARHENGGAYGLGRDTLWAQFTVGKTASHQCQYSSNLRRFGLAAGEGEGVAVDLYRYDGAFADAAFEYFHRQFVEDHPLDDAL